METMTISQRIQFLQKIFCYVISSKSGREAVVKCPFESCPTRTDKKKFKLAIRVSDFYNHCWVCGWKSRTLLPIIRKYARHLEQEYVKNFSIASKFDVDKIDSSVNKVLSLPLEFEPIVFLSKDHIARKYLLSRNILDKDIWKYLLGWCESGEQAYRIICPSFDFNGDLNFWLGRHIRNKFPKYVNPTIPANTIIFNELQTDFTKEVIICEGVFDAIKCGENVIPLLGSSLDENHILFDVLVKNNTPITLFLDADANKKMFNMGLKLASYDLNVKIAKSNPDPGAMSYEEVKLALSNAKELTWELKIFNKLNNVIF